MTAAHVAQLDAHFARNDELETLRALLKEAGERLDPRGSLRAPEMPGNSIHDRIKAALKPKPAPLPYTVGGASGCAVVDANGVVLATVNGGAGRVSCDSEAQALATAEFIARACSAHPALVKFVRESRDVGRSFALGTYDVARANELIEAATGEKP